MVNYKEKIPPRKQTGSVDFRDVDSVVDDVEEETRGIDIQIDYNELMNVMIKSAAGGIATGIAVRAFLGEK